MALAALVTITANASVRPPLPAIPTTRDHVVVLVMENHEYGAIIGSSAAPYLNSLAADSVLLTQMYAIRHPSLPNYLALVGGSTFGIKTDCTDCSVYATNLVDQLEGANVGWRAYMESMPGPCFTGASSGLYVKKHNPFLYFDDIRTDPARCNNIFPLTQLDPDLQAETLPPFAWITPNLCNDMHDCSVSTGDSFAANLVPRILPQLGTDGILIVTFDEGTSGARCCKVARGGHIATIIAGPGARHGVRVTQTSDLYSLLQLIEDNWGRPHLRKAGCTCTPTLTGWGS